jgi:hypothetical protein
VTFLVEVPAKTPFSDQIYLATDASGWSSTAVRMDRVDALHYRVTRLFASGTSPVPLHARFLAVGRRRSKRNRHETARVLVVKNADYRVVRDIVYNWQDEDPFAPDNGSTLPTPFNPVPLPPHR